MIFPPTNLNALYHRFPSMDKISKYYLVAIKKNNNNFSFSLIQYNEYDYFKFVTLNNFPKFQNGLTFKCLLTLFKKKKKKRKKKKEIFSKRFS